MAKIKACVFDLDGVLVDTAKYHYLAWKELANKLGFDFTEEQNEQLKGVSRMASLELLMKIGNVQLPDDEKQKYASEKNKRYLEYVKKMKPDEILPGAKEFLIECKTAGVKTALGSASKNAPLILDRLNLNSLFDVVIDGNKVSKAKPDPEVFTKGADELKVAYDECIVFEDAEAGVEAAMAAEMKCVGIGSSSTLSKADFIIGGLHEVTLKKLLSLI